MWTFLGVAATEDQTPADEIRVLRCRRHITMSIHASVAETFTPILAMLQSKEQGVEAAASAAVQYKRCSVRHGCHAGQGGLTGARLPGQTLQAALWRLRRTSSQSSAWPWTATSVSARRRGPFASFTWAGQRATSAGR